MALNYKVGSFTLANSTGNQSFTGVGFQPTAVIFYGVQNNSFTSSASVDLSFGWGVSSSLRGCFGYAANDQAGTSIAGGHRSSTHAYRDCNNSGTIFRDFDFVSNDADGFTINVGTASTAVKIMYVAIGGKDVIAATAITDTSPSSIGTKSHTTTGVDPNLVILFTNGGGTTETQNGAGTPLGTIGMAAEDPSASLGQGYSGYYIAGLGATSNLAFRKQSTSKCVALLTTTGVTIEAGISSFDSEAFTLDWTTVSGTKRFYALALQLSSAFVGSFNHTTSTGEQEVTGVGFRPAGIMMQSYGATTSSSTRNNCRYHFGSATKKEVDERHMWIGRNKNRSGAPALTNGSTASSSTKCPEFYIESSGSPTLTTRADYEGVTTDGFMIDATTVDGSAREYIYCAIGDSQGSRLAAGGVG